MKLLKIFLWCLGLFVLSCAIYISIVVSEVHKKLQQIDIDYSIQSKEESVLEPGTHILRDDFDDFIHFTLKSEGFNPYNSANKLEESLKISGDKYLVNEEIILPKVLSNNCKRYNCIKFNIDFDNINPLLWKGLIGIEDFRFLEHDGIDFKSLLRAFIADVKAMKKVQGGSTLTMQLAKNLFLSNEKKLERKLREMVYAIYIEYKLSKEKIVTTYFNEVFWGVVGGVYIKGVKAASIAYFDKSPDKLTDYESSILIGMLKGPYFYNPVRHLDRLKKRTTIVFNRLKSLALVGSGEETLWDDNKWKSWLYRLKKKNKRKSIQSFYYVSRSLDNFLEPFEKFVFYQSITSINSMLKERTKGLDIATKFLALDKSCKETPCPQSFFHYTKPERNLEKAILKERHQVGSVLKPIIYEQLIELGKSLDDQVSTKPITLKLVSGKWTPKDASKVNEEYVDLRYAVKKSKNIPLIRVANEVGFDRLESKLQAYIPRLLKPLKEYPAQLLGSIEMSLEELGSSYLKYFEATCKNINKGKYTFEDSILYEMSKAKETTISKASRGAIKDILMFGKTGTTNNGLDNWYIAFDGKVFYAIWYGVDSNRQGKKLRLAGSTSAYKIFQNFQLYRGKQLYELYCND